MRKMQLWLLSFVLIFALLMAGCEKNGEPVGANATPDTRILSYVISTVADLDTAGNPTTNYKTTIYIAGSDIDGNIKEYEYATNADFTSIEVVARSLVEVSLDFAEAGSQHTIFVRAVDNLDAVDPSPASVTIQRNQGGVETAITNGPPNGADVSGAVTYDVAATSGTGAITAIHYRVNEAAWTSVAADENGNATIPITGMPNGSNIISFRGVRDDGLMDESPATVSLVVRAEFSPIVTSTSPVVEGGGWFEGVTLNFSWFTETGFYYGALPAEPYCFVAGSELAPPAEYNLNPDEAFGDGWSADATYAYEPPAGANTFYLKVRDAAGKCDTLRINFGAATPSLDQGILVVNGTDPATYGSQLQNKINASAYWGTFNVDFWDLFGTMSTPGVSSLPASATYVGGGSQLSPDVMAKYSTIVWLANEYGVDFALWQLTPVFAYLQAGGNMIFASRYASDFIDANLTAYSNVSWREISGAAIQIFEFEPVYPGLVRFTPFIRGMTGADVYSGGGFLNSADDGTVTNWDGVSGYTKSDRKTTLLWAHRSENYDPSYPIAFVRGLGSWAHPNFLFSSVSAGNEHPTPGTDEARGNFIIIMGRHYGFDIAATSANFDFMLKNMCGEQ
jgi:hypothetical protein